MNSVNVIGSEIISGGLFESRIPAMTRPQLAIGPQKCTVFGPTGELIKAITLSMDFFAIIFLIINN